MRHIFSGAAILGLGAILGVSTAFAGSKKHEHPPVNSDRAPIAYVVPPPEHHETNAVGGNVDSFGYTVSPEDATGSIILTPAPKPTPQKDRDSGPRG